MQVTFVTVSYLFYPNLHFLICKRYIWLQKFSCVLHTATVFIKLQRFIDTLNKLFTSSSKEQHFRQLIYLKFSSKAANRL